ncbi:MAG: starch-binding protein, partial [Ruminococcus sp.]
FTVSGGQIKGQIGSTGIAVVYNAVSTPIASVNPGSKSYKTDSLELKLEYANATSGQYSIDGGEYKSFTNGQTITIGAGLPYGTKTTVSVKASDGSATSEVASYTYTKVDPSLTQKVYFDNKAYNWSSVYCYIYDGSGSGGSSGGGGNSGGGNTDIGGGGSGGGSDTPVTPSGTIQFTDNQGWGDNIYAYFWSDNQIDLGGAWPGTKMGNPTNNGLGQNNYSCSIPSGATYVIFTNGSDQTVDISLSSYDGYYTDGTRDSSGHLNAYGWNSTGLLSVGSSKDILSVGDDGVDTTPCNAPWPGQKMTLDSSTGYYIIDVPEGFENGCVIFTEGATATTNRYPADMEPGLELGGSTKLFSANHSWTDYTPVTTTTKATTTTTATTSTTTTTTTPVKTYYYGDVNLDGVITVRDATALQKYCASQSTLIAIQKQASDVNADGAIDVRDVSAIQKYLLSFIKSFPAGTTFTA